MSSPSQPSHAQSEDAYYIAFALTHVEYAKGDSLGFFLAVLCLLPVATLCGLAALLLFRRELHTATITLGVICNEVVNWGLKRVIAEPRPIRTSVSSTFHEMVHPTPTTTANTPIQVQFTEHGMPSSHAQFAWFFSIYMIIFMFHKATFQHSVWKYLISLFLLSVSVLICCGRVYLSYHTQAQVIAGSFIGSFIGILWYLLTTHFFQPVLFPWIESWSLSKYFYIKDSAHVPNVLKWEYEQSFKGRAKRD